MKQVFDQTLRLMGNRFQLSVVAEDADWARYCIEAGIEEIKRIERLLTTFDENSETALINRNAGISPVPVSEEICWLIDRSLRISAVTQGAFDITYGSADKRFWNFDVHMTSLPDRQILRQTVKKINFRNIQLDLKNNQVFLKEKGMRIGFGGIGKGYAADRARQLMKSMGVEAGIVNASGDLATWGRQPGGDPWTIGIAHPDAKDAIFSTLCITDMAVATSGNYEKFATIAGKRYSHSIDPRTGMPISGVKSVTTVSASAELADAMATPVMIMGIRPALHMINQIPGIEVIIIDDENRIHQSDNIHFN